jgi:hypothetical protein
MVNVIEPGMEEVNKSPQIGVLDRLIHILPTITRSRDGTRNGGVIPDKVLDNRSPRLTSTCEGYLGVVMGILPCAWYWKLSSRDFILRIGP